MILSSLHQVYERFPDVSRDRYCGLRMRGQLRLDAHLTEPRLVAKQGADSVCNLLRSIACVDTEAAIHDEGYIACLLYIVL